jgi:hypothetical protein
VRRSLADPDGVGNRAAESARAVHSPAIDLKVLAKQARRELADAAADEIVRWAVRTFSDRVCVTSSMTDTVIIDLASRVKPGIDVIFLDTGYHFAETLGTRDAAATIYPVNLINVTPSRTVEEQERDLGPRLYGRNPDLCCYLRKVVPLERALEPYDAWITGLRREETTSRRDSHDRGVGFTPEDGQGQPDRGLVTGRRGRLHRSVRRAGESACLRGLPINWLRDVHGAGCDGRRSAQRALAWY